MIWSIKFSSAIFQIELQNILYYIHVYALVSLQLIPVLSFKTHERDLNSKLAMDLKREMLLALVKGEMYPDDPEKKKKILNRYKEYSIPVSIGRFSWLFSAI